MKGLRWAIALALTVAVAAAQEPAPEEGAGSDPLADIFGEEMTMKAGRMQMDFDPETGEMTVMQIEGAVDIVSQNMNLACDKLEIDMVKQIMIATGKLVDFEREDVKGRCGRLEYEIETKKTHFTGVPRPRVQQREKSGRITETVADRITMIQNKNKNNILWDGNAELRVLPSPSAPKAESAEKKPAERIDNGSVGRLRSPAVDTGR